MAEQKSSTEAFIDATHDVVRVGIDAGTRVAREVIDAGTDVARTVRQSLKHAVDTSLGDSRQTNGAANRSSSRKASAEAS